MNSNNQDTVLVIGGAGYVGSVLCGKLDKLGFKVRILDALLYGAECLKRLQEQELHRVICHIGDFREAGEVIRAMDGVKSVIHLGAIVGDAACELNQKLAIETNLIATRQIAQIAKALSVERFIFASTCSVYGRFSNCLVTRTRFNKAKADIPYATEDDHYAIKPVSIYARTKLAAEKMLLAMADHRFTPTILRFATIYGFSYRPRFDLVVNLFAAMAKTERRIIIYGKDQGRPFVHIADVCDAIIKTLSAPKELVGGEIFNVGANEANYRIEQVARIIKELLPNTDIQKEDKIIDTRNYFVRFDKIIRRLNFAPKQTIREGIKEIIDAIEQEKITNYHAPEYNNYLSLKSALGNRRREENLKSIKVLCGAI